MKTTTALMFLAIGWAIAPCAAGPDETLGSFEVVAAPETTRAIVPLTDEAARRYLEVRFTLWQRARRLTEEQELDAPYGFLPYNGPGSLPGEAPDAAFRRNFPFPPMRYVPLWPRGTDMLSGPRPGVAAVEAWTEEWDEARRAQGLAGEKRVLWRWDVPAEWRKEWPFFSDFAYRDRFAVLGVVARRWIDGKETASERDPVVFCFDALNGLRWRADVPVRAAVHAYAAQAGVTLELSSRGAGGEGLIVGAARDGSRVWVAAEWSKPRVSLLFVFGADGKVRRTLALPARLLAGWLRRCPTRDRFILNFSWSVPREVREQLSFGGDVDDAYLLSADGDLLGRLVDERGLPVRYTRLSDTHALGSQPQKGGSDRRFLYRLP